MKKCIIYLTILILLSSSHSIGQPQFPAVDSLDINNINAAILAHGDMWNDPVHGGSHCRFPKNSQTNIAFAGSLWLSGFDNSNQLYTSAQTYRYIGSDFWPGPLSASDTVTYASSHDWAKLWKVNRSEIQYYQLLSTHDLTNTPSSILSWPGKGNTYAAGNGGVALSVTTSMAPFIDMNGDGIYDPLSGDYPDIKGDQAIWLVFSDNGPSHHGSNGKPLGVEIHALAYAYRRGTLVDNMIFFDYTILNKSARNYHNVRIGVFSDPELGVGSNDYIGFDSSHRMGICYNGAANDSVSPYPPYSFGTRIPVTGLTIISSPGDSAGVHKPLGSFVYFANSGLELGGPISDIEFNHYMRSRTRNGQHFKNDFVRRDSVSIGYGSGQDVDCIFNGDPSDTNAWSECNCNNVSGDRKFVLSTSDFILNAGGTTQLSMALITTYPDTLNACPGVSFDSIKIYADTAWGIFHHPPASLPVTGVESVVNPVNVEIYPNPAHDKLIVDFKTGTPQDVRIKISNVIGATIEIPSKYKTNSREVDISSLSPGLYMINIIDNFGQRTFKFVKE